MRSIFSKKSIGRLPESNPHTGGSVRGNEILDRWHKTEQAHAHATHADRPQALFARMEAEQDAIEHFGLGLHVKAYQARFPGEELGA